MWWVLHLKEDTGMLEREQGKQSGRRFNICDVWRQAEIIEDIKGISTDVFNIKKKLFLYHLDESIVFLVIKKNKIIEY